MRILLRRNNLSVFIHDPAARKTLLLAHPRSLAQQTNQTDIRFAVAPVAKEGLGMLAKLHCVCVAGEVGVRRGLGDLHARALFLGRREGSQDEAAAPENVAQR